MSTTFKTSNGDTFESIARKVYGTEQEANRIAQANPGVSEPFLSGVELVVPANTDAPKISVAPAPASEQNETTIKLNGTRFRFWDSVVITRAIDVMDTVQFTAPFDHEAPGFKETFRPFSFQSAEVYVGGEPLFTGTVISIAPSVESDSKTLDVNAYSVPGILNDCTAPASAYPIEFNGFGLENVAKALAKPFGIDVEFLASQGQTFERVACTPGTRILSFLSQLARQRNLLISSSADGKLQFLRSVAPGSPVAVLTQGQSPVMAVRPSFNPQEYYSHITGIEPVILGLDGVQYTVKNTRIAGVMRPLTFTAPDTLDADIKVAVEAKAARMFANMVSYDLTVNTWRDPSGKLWEPNTTLKLEAPDAMIYSSYEFVIRSVQYERNRNQESATLNLILPGAFAGEIPESLPWDE